MRALVSINAELKRRQRLFAKADVNHINQYQKKYKLGEVSEPMPHLFLISDEFAELKSNQPEFMKELVSTARIGRSLGIHLILATQKPSGVVDDQIWSNSRFKLALKVADRGDSMEMLHTQMPPRLHKQDVPTSKLVIMKSMNSSNQHGQEQITNLKKTTKGLKTIPFIPSTTLANTKS